MGQCSTLPAEARASSSVASHHNGNNAGGAAGRYHPANMSGPNNNNANESQHLRDDRKEGFDFNKIITLEQHPTAEPTKPYGPRRGADPLAKVNTPPQTRGDQMVAGSNGYRQEDVDDDMDVDADDRDEAPMDIPQPPEIAIRTRCYKLNLDSDIIGLSTTQKHQLLLGPFTEPPPFLTYSSSEDSSSNYTPVTTAIQTAEIFRGITISREGVILTQNARATRSNRGSATNKTKRGERSRQATKIDKAKDLVEETMATGKAPESDDAAHMMALYIVGEYDDMKHLVRDGSKRLREAEGHPDEVLFNSNYPRHAKPKNPVPSSSTVQSMLSPRKRSSPNYGQRAAGLLPHNASSERLTAADGNANNHLGATLPNSAPPKLKSHPRDTRGTRPRVRLDSCHDFMDPRHDNGEWSHAWNLWNCGNMGTSSPMQPSSPKEAAAQQQAAAAAAAAMSPTSPTTAATNGSSPHHLHHHQTSLPPPAPSQQYPMNEGREAFGNPREAGITSRAH